MKPTTKIALTFLFLFISTFFQGCSETSPTVDQSNIQLNISEIVAEGLNQPVALSHAGDNSQRLFIVEQTGLIRVIENGQLLETPFLDIQPAVSTGSEQGLLGLAFHPDYEKNGHVFINYTDLQGATNIVRYTVSEDHNILDPDSAFQIMLIPQPFANHNGGQLAFGPDGYLYIGMGDGGSANDPQDNAQNLGSPLGKMLRVDVNGEMPLAIPDDNPFMETAGADPRIWAYGLRNPWRFSFDRLTGDLYIGDVGQNRWEEVNFQFGEEMGGQNYGWVCREATHENKNRPYCDDSDKRSQFVEPVTEYDHREGISIAGGYVYRGREYPQIEGVYFFADYGSGKIWSIQLLDRESQAWSSRKLNLIAGFNISSFGEDENGELYVVDYSGGTIRKLAAK